MRREEQDHAGHVGGGADPGEWRHVDECLLDLGLVAEEAARERGVDQSRRDRVDADPEWRVLERGGLGELRDGCLRGAVGRQAGCGDAVVERRDVHDRAAGQLVLDRSAAELARAEERPACDHVVDALPFLDREAHDRAEQVVKRVVDEDARDAELVDRGVERRAHVNLVRDVAGERDGATAGLLVVQRARGVLRPVAVELEDEHIRAGNHEMARDVVAEPLARTRHDCGTVGELEVEARGRLGRGDQAVARRKSE